MASAPTSMYDAARKKNHSVVSGRLTAGTDCPARQWSFRYPSG
jgi:hypothetical protein